jgi:hypothetical protein
VEFSSVRLVAETFDVEVHALPSGHRSGKIIFNRGLPQNYFATNKQKVVFDFVPWLCLFMPPRDGTASCRPAFGDGRWMTKFARGPRPSSIAAAAGGALAAAAMIFATAAFAPSAPGSLLQLLLLQLLHPA